MAARRDNFTNAILDGWWTGAGTFESLHRAAKLVVEGGANRTCDDDAAAGGMAGVAAPQLSAQVAKK